jgi:hydrophobe/amphiphile efflux-1 (HAE1) family protein
LHISEVSIRHPVFAWMLMAALILFGGIGFFKMGVSQFPDVDFPYVSIQLTFTGAAPEVMEKDVIDPVESAIVSIQGIKKITSSALNGRGNVSVEFELDKNVDVAVQEIQTAIARAQRNLPKELDPPIITKSNLEDQPIMWLSLRSDKLSKEELMYLVRGQVRDQISTVKGVAEVTLGGYVEPALRVDLDAQKLYNFQLTVDDIIASIQKEHKEEPAGRMESPTTEQAVRVMGEAATVKEFEDVVIKRRAGAPNYAPIKITGVANIHEGISEVRRISRVQGKDAVGLGIRKQRGSNAMDVGNAVKARMAQIEKTLPAGTQMAVNFDTTPYIQETVHELLFTIFLAAILTAIVCWGFLGSWSSTLNVLLAIPTSIVGAFFVMSVFGFTLNTFSLLGLSLAIGIVVDDAIIVLENIMRHNEMGKTRFASAIFGSREITFAVLATTLSLTAIFLPVAFMKGIMGKFFFQFSVTLCVAVGLSLLEALTLAPMRCSQFLSTAERTTKMGRWIEGSLAALTSTYKVLLPKFLDRRWTTIGGATLFFAASLGLLYFIKKEASPSLDESRLFIQCKTKQGSSLEFTSNQLKAIEDIVMKDPNIVRYFAAVGGFSGGESNSGFLFVTLKPPGERPKDEKLGHRLTQDEVAEKFRDLFKPVKDITAFIPSGGGGVLGGGGQGYAVEFSIRGPDWEQLVAYAEQITTEMKKDPDFVDVNMPDVKGAPEVRIVPDREAALRMGVEIAEISHAVRALFGGETAGLYSKGGIRYDVIVQLKEADRKNVQQLQNILVRNTRGELVKLGNLVKFEDKLTPPSISREDRVRSITITSNIGKKVDQEKALAKAQAITAKTLKEGYFMVLSGGSEAYKESFQSLIMALLLGIIIAYMVLGSQFNSFTDPLVVLTALPFALSGAFIGLLVFGQSLNIYSFIGIILLVGIVKKNSILLVDFTNQARDRGLGINDALVEACPTRLRPILMTSFATLAAAIPGALNFGPGSETRVPMSVVMIGGVIVSTGFTLFVVPCLYSVVSRKNRDVGKDLEELETLRAPASKPKKELETWA